MNNKEMEEHFEEVMNNEEMVKLGIPKRIPKAVGYLESNTKFDKYNSRKDVDRKFVKKLKQVWNKGMVIGSMGHHDCPFCYSATSSCEKMLHDKKTNITYCFPKMIFHYIKAHLFKPPKEFRRFIMEDC